MDALGIVVWIALSLVIAAVLVTAAQPKGGVMYRAIVYTVAGTLLGGFVGSEGFKDGWGWFSSDMGPDVDGFQLVMGIIGALVVGALALLASLTPATGPAGDVP
jgi:hypothetical protein